MAQITWKSLNKRQQDYLVAIYQADQEVETREHSVSWYRGEHARPAELWRWLPYATSYPSGLPMPAKKWLAWTKQINEGTGSTLVALEKRGLILVEHLSVGQLHQRGILSSWQWILEEDEAVPVLQITPAGRKLVRTALNLPASKMVVGSLQEWHWRALVKAYEAGEQGVPEAGLGYGRIGWNTWLRLRDYKIRGEEYPLIQERNGVSITAWGIGYYERVFARYREQYPDVAAPAPAKHHDPLEPFVEVVQANRLCLACTGRYLVAVTRIYQQDRKGVWSVSEQEQRIPGLVVRKYEETEQCGCQEGEIQEIRMPFLPLLDQLAEQGGWQIGFLYDHWFNYLDYLVGGINPQREQRWYRPSFAKEKMQHLEDGTDIADNRNIVRGEVRYYWNPRTMKGKIYPRTATGETSLFPVALARKGNEAQ